jgi:RNA polymerase sigma factor (sigma-70 family)
VDIADEHLGDSSERDDPAAFVELFWRHGPAVHSYLTRRAGRQDADDLLSEVWLRAFKGRASRQSPDVLPWLYGIARNVLSAHWHQQARPAAPAEFSGAFDPWPDADSRLDAEAKRDSIGRILAMLSPDEREVLLLVVWEQLTPAEVAAVLGVPQGTARSRLHRAMTTFREEGAAHRPVLTCSDPKEA